jgi:hypothetical protein
MFIMAKFGSLNIKNVLELEFKQIFANTFTVKFPLHTLILLNMLKFVPWLVHVVLVLIFEGDHVKPKENVHLH